MGWVGLGVGAWGDGLGSRPAKDDFGVKAWRFVRMSRCKLTKFRLERVEG